jgi:hypothetical protein
VGEDESAERRLVGQLLLGGLGLFLLASGGYAYFGGRNDQLVGAFFLFAGLVLVVLAAFFSRVDGIVELGLLRIPAVKARRAEHQLAQGRVVGADKLDEARRAVEGTLARYHVAQIRSTAGRSAAAQSERRDVLVVEDAVVMMSTLTPNELELVAIELDRLSRLDYQTDSDLHATRPGGAGRSYLMHRVPECDVRLWYRQKSDSEPHTLFVMVVEKTGEDH